MIKLENPPPPKKIPNGKFQTTRPVVKPRKRWKDVVQRDTLEVLGVEGR
jgi:hypothetical protein